MSNKEYAKWPEKIRYHYDKTKEDIEKHGHSIKGVTGSKHDDRPFAYTVGASLYIDSEYASFFPIKNEGFPIVAQVINRVIDSIKKNKLKPKSQIINNESIYYLPVVMYILEETERTLAESFWFNQLERDGFLSEFSTENHELAILIFTDKHGTLPWDPTCESYWPDICPAPILAEAQHKITGNDTLFKKIQKNLDRL